MTKIYKNNFRFIADRYEEWQAGRCISKGPISTEIVAEVYGDTIHFELDEIEELKILTSFDFLCGEEISADLGSRIQYTNATSDFNPIVPIVCHLFYSGNRIEYVRFAMTNPDRLIEFYGEMVELGQPSKGNHRANVKDSAMTAEDIMSELDNYGMLNVDALMERAIKLYNANAEIHSVANADAIVEALKLFVEACNLERGKLDEEGDEYSIWMPKMLMYIALCNYKIGNVNSAYHIAYKALDEIDVVEEHSPISGIPRDIYGEPTIKELIDIIENQHLDEVDTDMDYDEVDELDIDLEKYYNLKHKANLDSLANKSTEAQKIKQLVEVVEKVDSQYWEAGNASGNFDKQVQFHAMFELIKNALYYSWEKLGCGHHSDFWKEGDSMFDYMMFEMGPEDRINAIIQVLEQCSPFAPIERNSAITNGLLSVFRKVLHL